MQAQIKQGRDAHADSKIRIVGVSKSYAQGGAQLRVLDQVSLSAYDGEFVSIIGPSGCGKSTLLNIVAGLEAPTSGSVHIEGVEETNRLGAVGYMQQKDLLLPWRRVFDNAILGLEVRGEPKSRTRERAMALIQQFGLAGFENEYPSALSGGMRQRVSFLRTVLADQQVFLLDEPFGALDALNRSQMHEWLQSQWERFRKTVILVTHDVDEAIFLSDRVFVMSERPGTLKRMETVPFSRPRTLDILTTPAFVDLKADLLRSIRGVASEVPR
jgi:ABC-type nitrate/sulfonate/bicarbonate transport system ATPase subunit